MGGNPQGGSLIESVEIFNIVEVVTSIDIVYTKLNNHVVVVDQSRTF